MKCLIVGIDDIFSPLLQQQQDVAQAAADETVAQMIRVS